MNDAMIMIAAADIRSAIRSEPDLVRRIEKAFAKAQHFFMSTDDNLRFSGALAAVLMETADEDEKERVVASKRALDRFSAFLTAAQAGLSIDPSSLPGDEEDYLPLMKMWHDAKAAAGRSRAA